MDRLHMSRMFVKNQPSCATVADKAFSACQSATAPTTRFDSHAILMRGTASAVSLFIALIALFLSLLVLNDLSGVIILLVASLVWVLSIRISRIIPFVSPVFSR